VTTIAPVRKQVIIEASAEHCFRVFTDGVGTWWPKQHHIGTSPLKLAVIEPRAGGRWYAISEDASECDTGKVLVWDPPRRLVLAWQITADWTFDPDFVTEVEVTFTPDGPTRTVVVLEHRDLERFGERAEELRNGVDAEGGWGAILGSYAEAAAR
jgi:uncharacterized protein YndB with AHSA1/START domain